MIRRRIAPILVAAIGQVVQDCGWHDRSLRDIRAVGHREPLSLCAKPGCDAIRGGQADIEFRGFPPKARDDLVAALVEEAQEARADLVGGQGLHPGAARGPVQVHDMHATILKLFGLDHEKLTYRFQGRDFRLTDVAGKIVNQLVSTES